MKRRETSYSIARELSGGVTGVVQNIVGFSSMSKKGVMEHQPEQHAGETKGRRGWKNSAPPSILIDRRSRDIGEWRVIVLLALRSARFLVVPLNSVRKS